jgi:hypothetical protein
MDVLNCDRTVEQISQRNVVWINCNGGATAGRGYAGMVNRWSLTMDKTVYVPASFKEIRESRTIQVPSGKRGFLGHERTIVEQRWVTGGYSDCEIDGQRLQRDVQLVVDELNDGGYDIVSLVPVESGTYNWSPEGYSYGYSYTEGVIVLARKLT